MPQVNNVFDVAGLIVILAIIAQIVTSKNVAAQIAAIGNAFSGSLRAATGK